MERMNPGARALYALLWLVGRLPLRALHGLGDAFAWLVRGLRPAAIRVVQRNLELSFPDLAPAERTALAQQSLRQAACTLFETCAVWTRPSARNLALLRAVEGEDLLDAAQRAGRGLIVAAPHLGNWELLNQYLASRAPIAIVYRPPRQAWVEDLLRRTRAHPGVIQVRAEAAGVRQLFRVLKDGGTLGILPDQQPKAGEGLFAPFFGVPALSMTLLPRLAERTGATVLFAWCERLPHSAGFRIRVRPAPDGIADPDPARAVAALNAGVEACVREAPAQYQWNYKRFSKRPVGLPPRY